MMVSGPTPSRSSAGRAVKARPLVAIAHFTPASVSSASSSRAPGSAVTEPACLRYSTECASWSWLISSGVSVRPVSRSSACTNRPPLIPIRRWMRHTERSTPIVSRAVCQAVTCWYTLSISVPSRSNKNAGTGTRG